MRRYVLLVSMVVLVALVFAPMALAQDGSATASATAASAAAGGNDDATATPSATPSASASASASATASASAAVGGTLPGTGGVPLVSLLSAAAMVFLVGSGLVAGRLVRRNH
jgi:hypothetical protein